MSHSIKSQFLGVQNENSGPQRCRYFVIPVPYEKTTSYAHGTKYGPKAVIDASVQVELWDEISKKEIWKLGINTLPAVNCEGSAKTVFARIDKTVRDVLRYKGTPFFIGGEHSITQALLPPFIDKYKGLSVLHFDAHADLRKTYEGSEQSHACALYPASKKCRVVQVGIRSVGVDEKQNINSGNVVTFLRHEHRDVSKLIPQVLKNLTDTVYITIDVDGFDPSVIPGTGTPQPGGFSWFEGLDIFQAVCAKKKVVGVDVVEASPVKGSVITEFATSKLICQLMGFLSDK